MSTLTAIDVLTGSHPVAHRRWLVKIGLDVVVYVAALVVAYLLRFDGVPAEPHLAWMLQLLVVVPLLRIGVGWWLGTHRCSWRLFGLPEALVVLRSVGLVSAALVVARLVVPFISPGALVVPLSVIALEGLGAAGAMLAVRIGTRVLDERMHRERNQADASPSRRRALLIGAGRAGRMAVRELRLRPDAGFDPVGFLDDDPTRRGQLIEGVPVLGTTAEAAEVARRINAQDLVLTMPAASPDVRQLIAERCKSTGLPLQTVPGLYELISGKVGITRIRPLRTEDLLGRQVVRLDDDARRRVAEAFVGKRIVVTGAGGSIGSELCRQLARLSPASLVLLERNENNLFDIEQEMRGLLGDRAVPCLADVADPEQVELAFARHRPEVVVHAAAYKHVPMMELHPEAAVHNNVRGTRVVVEAAHRHGVGRFVLVSTDKAVNPTSVMGASKRVAELVLHGRASTSKMRSCAVRFGNVLGSRGSVLHTFQRQIERGGPVTVTHPDVTRFFMTIPEAVRLLLQAAAIGEGGETFLLEMGESVRILDVARRMITLAGLTERDVPIEFVGLRPGEKLYEELLRHGEHACDSGVDGILLARGAGTDAVRVREQIAALEYAGEVRDVEAIRAMLGGLTGYAEPPHAAA